MHQVGSPMEGLLNQSLDDTSDQQSPIEEDDQQIEQDSDGDQIFSDDDDAEIFEGFDDDDINNLNLTVFSNPHGLTSCLFLMKLPVELRLLVYKYLAPSAEEIAGHHQSYQHRRLDCNKTAILRSCKKIYNECLPEYYGGSAWPIQHIFPKASLLFLDHTIKLNDELNVISRHETFDAVKMLSLTINVTTISLRTLWWRPWWPVQCIDERSKDVVDIQGRPQERPMVDEIEAFNTELQQLAHFFHPSNRPRNLEKLSVIFILGAGLRSEFRWLGQKIFSEFMNGWMAFTRSLLSSFEGKIELVVEDIPMRSCIVGNGVGIQSTLDGNEPAPTPFHKAANFIHGAQVSTLKSGWHGFQSVWRSHHLAIDLLGFPEYIFQHLCGEILPHAENELMLPFNDYPEYNTFED